MKDDDVKLVMYFVVTGVFVSCSVLACGWFLWLMISHFGWYAVAVLTFIMLAAAGSALLAFHVIEHDK